MSNDLSSKIAAAEQRLIARDQRVRQRWNDLGRHVRRAVEPQRLAMPLLAGAGVILLGWLIGHRRGGTASTLATTRHRRSLLARVPWMRMVALALPLLPLQWRQRLQPSSIVGTVVRAYRDRTAAPRVAIAAPPRTVDAVDLSRYLGKWHEIARLPNRYERACAGQPTATYSLRDGELNVTNRCLARSGRLRTSHGVARVVAGSRGARLKVTFAPSWLRWWPAVWADYWILHVDADYQFALVGTPQRDALWLLARSDHLDEAQRVQLLRVASEQGYDVRQLTYG